MVKILPEGMIFNDDYFITEILDPIYQNTARLREETGKKLYSILTMQHVSKKVLKYLTSHDMERAPQPPYSSDLAPSDFYLSEYIKGLLAGRSFNSAEELLSAVDEILSEISETTLMRVFKNWEERLKQVIELKGDYIE